MSILNLGKFTSCLGKYKEHCDRTLWTKNELPKFYFANLLSRRIHLNIQNPKTIFEICRRVQEKHFYYKPIDTNVCGLQFLPGTGITRFSEALSEQDAELFKELVYLNWVEKDFQRASISLNSLSGWLGTLLPAKFIPVTSNHFRHTIAYLFDLELKIYNETDYDYFVHSQKYFHLTKKRLKEFNLDSLYLKAIREYVRISYPKSVIKRQYDEYDWNWLTQDFHLYVYREVLGLDSIGGAARHRNAQRPASVPPPTGNAFETPEVLNIYVP